MKNSVITIGFLITVILVMICHAFAQEKGGSTDYNQGVIAMTMATNQQIPNPFPPSAIGVYAGFAWTQLEPQRNVFNWNPITDLEKNLPDNKILQISIGVGAYGSPTSQAACNFRGKAIPNCTPWLASVPGIKVHSVPGPNGASSYPSCTTLVEPNPSAPLYMQAWKGLVDALGKKFNNDPKIGLIGLMPMSDQGFNLSLSTVNSTDVTVCSPEYYNKAWNKLSNCNGNEVCWQNYVENTFKNLWSFEISRLSKQNLALWNPSFPYPSINDGDGSYDFDIRSANLNYASQHHPAQGTYQLANEALQASHSWSNAVKRWSVGANKLGAQMARSNANNCAELKTAGIQYGAGNGANWIQIYRPDFDACPGEIAAIASALSGKDW